MSIRVLLGRRSAEERPASLSASGNVRIDGAASFPTGLVAQGDLLMGPEARVEGDLQVGGALVMAEGACLVGDARVEGDAVLHPGARIEGGLFCRRVRMAAGPARRVPVEPEKADAAKPRR